MDSSEDRRKRAETGAGALAEERKGKKKRRDTSSMTTVGMDPRQFRPQYETSPPPYEIFSMAEKVYKQVKAQVELGVCTPAEALETMSIQLSKTPLLCEQLDGLARTPAIRLCKELASELGSDYFYMPVVYKCGLKRCRNVEDFGRTRFSRCPHSGLYYCSTACRNAHARTPEFGQISLEREKELKRRAVERDIASGTGVQRSMRIVEAAEFSEAMQRYGEYIDAKRVATRRGETVRLVDAEGVEVSEDEYHRLLFGTGTSQVRALSDGGHSLFRTGSSGPNLTLMYEESKTRREDLIQTYDRLCQEHNALLRRIVELRRVEDAATASADASKAPPRVEEKEGEQGATPARDVACGAGSGAGSGSGPDTASGGIEEETESPHASIPPSLPASELDLETVPSVLVGDEPSRQDMSQAIFDLEIDARSIRSRALKIQQKWNSMLKKEREHAQAMHRLRVPPMETVIPEFRGYDKQLLHSILSAYGVDLSLPPIDTGGYSHYRVSLRCPFNSHAVMMDATTVVTPPNAASIPKGPHRDAIVNDYHFRKIAFIFRDMAQSPDMLLDCMSEIEYFSCMDRCTLLSGVPYGVMVTCPCGGIIVLGTPEQRKRAKIRDVDESVAELAEATRRMVLATGD